MLIATIVDWTALGKVVYYSFIGALLLTMLFTAGVLLTEGDGTRPAPAASRALGGLALLACLALLVFGISVLFDK